MAEMTSHQPGTFCWIELGTTDAEAAKAFYTGLFGWTTKENSMGEMGTYYMFQVNGKSAAAMYQMGADMAGIPPNWLSYVSVANADQSVEQAKVLGATVVNGPFDVYDYGRMAVLVDPEGAHFAMWEAKTHIGVEIRDEENTLCWNELQARDIPAAKTFYPALFGWRMKESPDYTEWHLGEHAIGGMLASSQPPEVPPFWMPYFAVADCDATVQKAQGSGAQLYVPPMDIDNVGRFAVLADPQGAVFAVIKVNG